MPKATNPGSHGLSRRTFMTGTLSAAAAVPLAVSENSAREQASAERDPESPVSVKLEVNGQIHELAIDTRTSLLDALRDRIGLTGTKKGCDHGQCGACTVLVDGRRILSCMSFAWMNEGHEVTTVEGLALADGSLHPVQQAFIDHDAFQCGYCTPGQIMSAIGCINEGHAGSEDEIREFMSGNLCRCAAYPNIVDAIVQAREQLRRA